MKIETTDLAQELACALKDMFVAQAQQSENVVTLRFTNGQTFHVKVEEA